MDSNCAFNNTLLLTSSKTMPSEGELKLLELVNTGALGSAQHSADIDIGFVRQFLDIYMPNEFHALGGVQKIILQHGDVDAAKAEAVEHRMAQANLLCFYLELWLRCLKSIEPAILLSPSNPLVVGLWLREKQPQLLEAVQHNATLCQLFYEFLNEQHRLPAKPITFTSDHVHKLVLAPLEAETTSIALRPSLERLARLEVLAELRQLKVSDSGDETTTMSPPSPLPPHSLLAHLVQALLAADFSIVVESLSRVLCSIEELPSLLPEELAAQIVAKAMRTQRIGHTFADLAANLITSIKLPDFVAAITKEDFCSPFTHILVLVKLAARLATPRTAQQCAELAARRERRMVEKEEERERMWEDEEMEEDEDEEEGEGEEEGNVQKNGEEEVGANSKEMVPTEPHQEVPEEPNAIGAAVAAKLADANPADDDGLQEKELDKENKQQQQQQHQDQEENCPHSADDGAAEEEAQSEEDKERLEKAGLVLEVLTEVCAYDFNTICPLLPIYQQIYSDEEFANFIRNLIMVGKFFKSLPAAVPFSEQALSAFVDALLLADSYFMEVVHKLFEMVAVLGIHTVNPVTVSIIEMIHAKSDYFEDDSYCGYKMVKPILLDMDPSKLDADHWELLDCAIRLLNLCGHRHDLEDENNLSARLLSIGLGEFGSSHFVRGPVVQLLGRLFPDQLAANGNWTKLFEANADDEQVKLTILSNVGHKLESLVKEEAEEEGENEEEEGQEGDDERDDDDDERTRQKREEEEPVAKRKKLVAKRRKLVAMAAEEDQAKDNNNCLEEKNSNSPMKTMGQQIGQLLNHPGWEEEESPTVLKLGIQICELLLPATSEKQQRKETGVGLLRHCAAISPSKWAEMKAQLDLVEQRRRERNHREADLRSKIDEMIAAMGQNCTVGAGMRGDQCGSKDCY